MPRGKRGKKHPKLLPGQKTLQSFFSTSSSTSSAPSSTAKVSVANESNIYENSAQSENTQKSQKPHRLSSPQARASDTTKSLRRKRPPTDSSGIFPRGFAFCAPKIQAEIQRAGENGHAAVVIPGWLVGCQFHPGAQQHYHGDSTRKCRYLEAVVSRDPLNKHDPCAVTVSDTAGNILGHVERSVAAVVAPIMDARLQSSSSIAAEVLLPLRLSAKMPLFLLFNVRMGLYEKLLKLTLRNELEPAEGGGGSVKKMDGNPPDWFAQPQSIRKVKGAVRENDEDRSSMPRSSDKEGYKGFQSARSLKQSQSQRKRSAEKADKAEGLVDSEAAEFAIVAQLVQFAKARCEEKNDLFASFYRKERSEGALQKRKLARLKWSQKTLSGPALDQTVQRAKSDSWNYANVDILSNIFFSGILSIPDLVSALHE